MFIVLICLSVAVLSRAEHWVIALDESADPLEFANHHNLVYKGAVEHLPGYHEFSGQWHPNRARSSDNVQWSELQVPRRRFTRTADPLYRNQWHLQRYDIDIGLNAPAVWNETTGRGVTIAIVDDGLQQSHPDLQNQYVAVDSWNFNDNNSNPSPDYRDGHGTSCAGVCCAQRNNNVCGSGVCPDCKVAGIRLIGGPTTDVTEANAMAFHSKTIDIYSCSWGPSDDAKRLEGPGHLTRLTLEQRAKYGRNGKGSIFVWAGGNGARSGDNCNYDGYANNRFTIAIGALNNFGFKSSYSEPCSALLAVAPR